MIALRELQDDFFEYDEENYSIRGRHSGKVYMLGDKINVEIVKADLQKRQLDYRFCLIALYQLKQPGERFRLRDVFNDCLCAPVDVHFTFSGADIAIVCPGHFTRTIYDTPHHCDLHPCEMRSGFLDLSYRLLEIEFSPAACGA